MVEGIESRAAKEGIHLNAAWAHLCCMPHTIHLAAIKVCLINHLQFMILILMISCSYLKQLGPSPRWKPKRPHPEVATTKIQQRLPLVILTTTTLLHKMMETKRRLLVYPLMHLAIYYQLLKR